MSSPNLRIRRATTDYFRSLQALWNSMRLPADELEKRLTEFQVVEAADGQIVGAIGVQIIRQHALLHSEGYTDFAVADAALAASVRERQPPWSVNTLAQAVGVAALDDADYVARSRAMVCRQREVLLAELRRVGNPQGRRR